MNKLAIPRYVGAGLRARHPRPRTRSAIAIIALSAMLAIVVPPGIAHAQTITISAEVDRTTLSTDDTVTLSVKVTGGGNLPSPSLPAIDGLSVASQSTFHTFSFADGVTRAELLVSYILRPTRTGDVTIPAISVVIAGRAFSTQPIAVTVTQGSAQPAPAPQPAPSDSSPAASAKLTGQDYFVESAVDNEAPYLGEQIVHTFRFYRAIDFFGQPDYDAPGFTGFWHQQESEQQRYRVSAAGRTYRVVELNTVLFPTIVGEQTIEPGQITIPGGLFTQVTELRTEPVGVKVAPLPSGAPAGFKGAVGVLAIKAEVDTTSVPVNEPVNLTVTVSGEGNVQAFADPEWPEMRDWRSFDSRAAVSSEVRDRKLSGSKVYERVMVPSEAGDFSIPPVEYSYFDPTEGEYRSIATQPIRIAVTPADADSEDSAAPLRGRERVERLATDIRHIKPVPADLDTATRPLTSSGVYWAAWLIPLVVLATGLGWRRRMLGLGRDTAETRSARAYRNARRMVDQARRERADPFEASDAAIKAYLRDKLDRPIAGMTRTTLSTLLSVRGVDEAVIKRATELLAASEGGRFAPGHVADTPEQQQLEDTAAIIGDLEKEL